MGIYSKKYIEKLNQDIRNYPEVKPIDPQMKLTFEGISRLVMRIHNTRLVELERSFSTLETI